MVAISLHFVLQRFPEEAPEFHCGSPGWPGFVFKRKLVVVQFSWLQWRPNNSSAETVSRLRVLSAATGVVFGLYCFTHVRLNSGR